MRFQWTVLAAATGLVACGAHRERSPRTEPGAAPIERMELSDDGLRLQFGPRVERKEAVARVLRCKRVIDPDNPRLDRVACPVDLGNVRIDVAEGPSGVALTLAVDLVDAKALATWFERDVDAR